MTPFWSNAELEPWQDTLMRTWQRRLDVLARVRSQRVTILCFVGRPVVF